MNRNPPAYRTWLALLLLGLSFFNLLVSFDFVASLPEPWDTMNFVVVLALFIGLLGSLKWEERRERKADRAA